MTEAEHAGHAAKPQRSPPAAAAMIMPATAITIIADSSPPADDTVRVLDPVCGMKVDPATSKHRFDYRGETFHFCSAGCRTKFEADPKKYLEKDKTRRRRG